MRKQKIKYWTLLLIGVTMVIISTYYAKQTFPFNLPFSIFGGFMLGNYAINLYKLKK